mgnify:FL=1
MSNENPMLEVKNLSKSFGTIKALDNVSFTLPRGKVFGIVGDNNAGRTTLLSILNGALQPDSGEFYLDGQKADFKNPSDAYDSGVAMVHQFVKLVDIASIWENFYLGRELTRKSGPITLLDLKKMRETTQKTISGYGHKFDVDREVRQLSGGQRQIVAVTRAIDTNPKLLLLDEPYHGLSQRVINDIFAILKDARESRGTSIIITTQWFEQIKDFVDEVMVMRRGRIVGHFDVEAADSGHIFKLAMGLAG